MTSQTVVINMTSFGHPEDVFSSTVIRYAGQDVSAREDFRIPLATVLLHRVEENYQAYHIRFVRTVRDRSRKDPMNPAMMNHRPVFEFENLGPILEIPLHWDYALCLEKKMYSLLRFGLVCKYKTVGRGILPCEVHGPENIPPLMDLLPHFRKEILIDMLTGKYNCN